VAETAADLDKDIQAAAAVLSGARQPLIAGLATDIEGVTAAIELARHVRGVVDHAWSAALLRDLNVMRNRGWIITTPLEARARADVVLLAGPGLHPAPDELKPLLDAAVPSYFPQTQRRILRVQSPPPLAGGGEGEGATDALIDQIAQLRMILAGRDVSAPNDIRETAEALRNARYSVIVWSAAHLTEPAIETICGLIEDLNAKTRCTGLPLTPGDNAAGAAQAAAWLTGYPLPVGFPRGFPEHDPWRFDATRLAESGEADAAIWIAALGTAAPPWQRALKLVALVTNKTSVATWLTKPHAVITVARPAIDHNATLYDPRVAALTARAAATPASTPSVGTVLRAIMAALPPC
jgi:formylmethanofuran dehydrogenase subunit B